MEANPLDDKTPVVVSGQRFQMLENCARELAGDVSFPTSFDLAIHWRIFLRKPDVSEGNGARIQRGAVLSREFKTEVQF